jgi:hypothetical protein
LIPVFIWNILFRSYLPEKYSFSEFKYDIPSFFRWTELISGMAIIILSFSLQLKIKNRIQKIGLILYFTGLILYLLAWRPIILYPNSDWSSSLFGFVSISFTPIVLLLGIGLIGKKLLFIKIKYRRSFFLILVFIYILSRTSHALLVYYQFC